MRYTQFGEAAFLLLSSIAPNFTLVAARWDEVSFVGGKILHVSVWKLRHTCDSSLLNGKGVRSDCRLFYMLPCQFFTRKASVLVATRAHARTHAYISIGNWFHE